jgi:hypothetical protein
MVLAVQWAIVDEVGALSFILEMIMSMESTQV